MKTDIADKWTTALRSGDYEQAKGNLAVDGKFCCLGVLCDIVSEDAGLIVRPFDNFIQFDGEIAVLPTSAKYYVGMNYNNGQISFDGMDLEFPPRIPEDGPDSRGGSEEIALSALNDQGFTFNQIADVIDYFKDEL